MYKVKAKQDEANDPDFPANDTFTLVDKDDDNLKTRLVVQDESGKYWWLRLSQVESIKVTSSLK